LKLLPEDNITDGRAGKDLFVQILLIGLSMAVTLIWKLKPHRKKIVQEGDATIYHIAS